MIKFDRTDINILIELQKSGQISNVELSKRVGLSESPCWKRVSRLEKSGIIKNYQVNLDLAKAIRCTTIFIEVGLEKQSAEGMQRFEQAVQNSPEITECYATQGKMDYLLKVVVPDFRDYLEFVEPILNGDFGVNQIVSSIVIQNVKESLPDLNYLLDLQSEAA